MKKRLTESYLRQIIREELEEELLSRKTKDRLKKFVKGVLAAALAAGALELGSYEDKKTRDTEAKLNTPRFETNLEESQIKKLVREAVAQLKKNKIL